MGLIHLAGHKLELPAGTYMRVSTVSGVSTMSLDVAVRGHSDGEQLGLFVGEFEGGSSYLRFSDYESTIRSYGKAWQIDEATIQEHLSGEEP